MHPTRNSLAADVRAAVIAELAPLLADAVDLSTQVKQAHWTVRGPTFMQLHLLFDAVAKEAQEWTDLIAERVGQLGGQAQGTARVSAAKSRLPEYPLNATAPAEHVEAVGARLALFGQHARAAIDTLAQRGDAVGADICTEVARGADEQLWFVESHGSG
ncbi:MAG: DNA starvation/stationary phase protection protein Dps, partial [Phycisphaerales bacterium]|nr:DNA starvation/stationary phase protection protein Dps [Phycisphaerales bacterium]